ncbi:MAG: hypothetical protein AAFV80_14305 [Bacteroidota bacterium]
MRLCSLLYAGLLFVIFLPFSACNTDKLPAPTEPSACDSLEVSYNLNIKPIIDASCAYAGCHVAGFPPGDWSSYDNMLPVLENGELERRVVTLRFDPANGMPPDIFVASPTLADLSDEDFELVRCWLEKGFPEN